MNTDEHLSEQARAVAQPQHRTRNTTLREWLLRFPSQASSGRELDALRKRLKYVKTDRTFSRDELNER